MFQLRTIEIFFELFLKRGHDLGVNFVPGYKLPVVETMQVFDEYLYGGRKKRGRVMVGRVLDFVFYL